MESYRTARGPRRQSVAYLGIVGPSELRIAEHIYERSALPDILGVPVEKIDDDRIYRSLDKLFVHKSELERYLANRLGELFGLEYDLLLFTVCRL